MTVSATHGEPRAARVARAVALSSAGTVAALTSHLAAGAPAPPVAGVLAVLVLAWPLAALLAGRRLTAPRSAAVVALSEAGFHAVFTVLAAGSSTRLAAPPSTMPGMAASPVPIAPAMHAASGMAADPAMWAAHAAAAVLTWALWLRGAAALDAVARVATRVGTALQPCVPIAPALPPAPPPPSLVVPRPRSATTDARSLRGPPSASVPA